MRRNADGKNVVKLRYILLKPIKRVRTDVIIPPVGEEGEKKRYLERKSIQHSNTKF
jgi:hypothetical protein